MKSTRLDLYLRLISLEHGWLGDTPVSDDKTTLLDGAYGLADLLQGISPRSSATEKYWLAYEEVIDEALRITFPRKIYTPAGYVLASFVREGNQS